MPPKNRNLLLTLRKSNKASVPSERAEESLSLEPFSFSNDPLTVQYSYEADFYFFLMVKLTCGLFETGFRSLTRSVYV